MFFIRGDNRGVEVYMPDTEQRSEIASPGSPVNSPASGDGAVLGVDDYHALFQHMLNGIAYCRMLFEEGEPVDFIILATNPAFESQTGLKNVVGRRVTEVIPGIRETNAQMFETYCRVARGGGPESFEVFVETLEMWFHVAAYSPKDEHFVAIFDVITERKRAEAERHRLTLTLQTVIDSVPHFVFWKDRQSRYLGCNRAYVSFARISGPEDMIGKDDFDFPWREFAPLYQQDDREVMSTGTAKYHIIEPIETPNGEIRWLETSKEPLRDEQGNVFGVLGQFQDITERKNNEDKLRQAAKVFEATAEGVIITDPAARIIAVNKAFTNITGYTEAEVLGRSPNLLKSDHHDAEFYRALWSSIATSGVWRGEIWNRRKSGEVYPEWLTIDTVKDADGHIVNYVAVFTDIGHVKAYEQRLEFLAHHDPLTGLPNRSLLSDRLERAIQHARREDEHVAVLFIDLDHFKKVNDGMGHPVGDQLLRAVAGRLEACVRGDDTVARIGGDEFVVILERMRDLQTASAVAEKMLATLTAPFRLLDQDVFVGASIGISTFPSDGEDPVILLKNSDAAMYRAKEEGRNNFCFYSAELTQAARDHLELEASLRQAIEQGQFVLHYQPQIDVGTGLLTGVEALVRWNHPNSGLVLPQRFIPFAEQSGLIVPLGYWVLETACSQLRRWQAEFGVSITMAINLSPRQFASRDLTAEISRILDQSGVDARLIELEITESAIMERGEKAIATLCALKELGVQLAIDDFGTGYSSLACLRRFPIDVLKIDRSFMRGIPEDNGAKEIASTIIAMGQNLQLSVVAEGVETEAQFEFLKLRGCHYSQGYLHARPMAADGLNGRFKTLAAAVRSSPSSEACP